MVMVSKSSYGQTRQNGLEENETRMEELNINPSTMKRGRGRPRKTTLPDQPEDVSVVRGSVLVKVLQTPGRKEVATNNVKRGRGTPRKSALSQQPVDASLNHVQTPGYQEVKEKMVITSKLAYEEIRQKRLEENKTRMKELNLNTLAQAFHASKAATMKKGRRTPKKSLLPKQPVNALFVRRSMRVRDLQTLGYEKVKINASKHDRDALLRQERKEMYAIQRAEDLESSLDQHIPSFIKPTNHSNICGSLRLPAHLCKKHLPRHDIIMTLVDEQGDEYPTKYLALNYSLGKGWIHFVSDHEVVYGDALVFQLIEPTIFKVYIVRA